VRGSRLEASVLGLALLLAGCGDPALLELKLVTPDGPDPLAGADRIRLVVTEPAAEQVVSHSGGSASLGLELQLEVAGAVGSVILEGLAGEALVARGETPPISLRPVDRELAFLVARAGALSRLQARLASPVRGPASVLLPSSGILLAGGTGQDGAPVATATLYDFFRHRSEVAAPMPGPRMGAVSATCGATCALVLLGANQSALEDRIFQFDGTVWRTIPDGLGPGERRRDASAVLLDDGSTLIVGGAGAVGPLDSVLRLDPGGTTLDPALGLEPARARAPRVAPAIAAASGAVVIAGGQAAGAVPLELYYPASASFQAPALPGPTLTGAGAAACALGDGRVAVVGGRDASGRLLRDGWIVDPVSITVQHLPDCLAEARADHALVRTGAQLVVVGGTGASGPTTWVEVLDAQTLARAGEATAATPRVGLAIGRLGPGSFLLMGGESAPADPLPTHLEVWQSARSYGK
jgi:hypothetical protein